MINISNLLKNISNINLLFIFMLIILSLSVIYGYNINNIENFSNNFLDTNNSYEFKENDNAFDSFYAKYYDSIYNTQKKNNYEIGKIKNLKKITDIKILVVNCDTGLLVRKISKLHNNVVGIDSSIDMINHSKNNYPKLEFYNKNILKENIFDDETFSHILCLNRKLYLLEDKQLFFNNCYNLLYRNGYLIVNIVDPKMFNFHVNESKNVLYDPTKYNKKIEEVIVLFGNNKEYKSKYKIKKNDLILEETFKNFNTNSVRKNKITYYMTDTRTIINYAEKAGFVVKDKFSLDNVGYNYEYLYIFKKSIE